MLHPVGESRLQSANVFGRCFVSWIAPRGKTLKTMKYRIQNLFLAFGITALVAMPAAAQTFTNLHAYITGSDGANPYAGLILSSNTLYGTANDGGSMGNGSVFAIATTGTGYTNLHNFAAADGVNPYAGLVLSGGMLYGTAYQGGGSGFGSVFAINTNGTGFTNLHNFASTSDGANPFAGLVLSGGMLYGTTSAGGSGGNGSVFAINTNSTGFTNLHSFVSVSDGASPYAGLVSSGGMLYGTTSAGGSGGSGSVFAINTNSTGFTNLHSFVSAGDGASPHSGLILFGNTLYGAATSGGSGGSGTLFAINTNSTGFTNLHSFASASDGANPNAVILSGNNLYGTATHGGSGSSGSLFAINTNSTGFTNLHSFVSASDGATPRAGLIVSGSTLYGTASSGGGGNNGSVFALILGTSTLTPIPLKIQLLGNATVLSWTNSAFTLQSAPAATGTYAGISGATNSPYTNSITGTQQFFRLIGN